MKGSHINGSYYYIQQVADITGMSKQLIRKWEERYELIHPRRLDNGYRVYSDTDINTLLAVKAFVDKGHSVKQAAMLVKTENSAMNTERHQERKQEEYKTMNDYVLQLLQNGAHCNEQVMSLILQQAYHQLGLHPFIASVVIPFLKEVGLRWERKEWSEYQEAISSLVVRDFLIQVRRNFQYRDNAPLLVGACLPYEQHEIPVHLLLLQAMLQGWKTALIGASPAPGSIEAVVTKLHPAKVLLSATTTMPFEADPTLLQHLDDLAATYEHIDFYLGGTGAVIYTTGKTMRAIKITNNMEDVLA